MERVNARRRKRRRRSRRATAGVTKGRKGDAAEYSGIFGGSGFRWWVRVVVIFFAAEQLLRLCPPKSTTRPKESPHGCPRPQGPTLISKKLKPKHHGSAIPAFDVSNLLPRPAFDKYDREEENQN
jgi:hypothetical protein